MINSVLVREIITTDRFRQHDKRDTKQQVK